MLIGFLIGVFGVAVFVLSDARFSGTPLVIHLLSSIAMISLTQMLPIETLLFWPLLAKLICLAPPASWIEGLAAYWTVPFVFSIVCRWVVVSILPFSLILHLIGTRNAARVSSLLYFIPLVRMLIAWPVFGEAPSLP